MTPGKAGEPSYSPYTIALCQQKGGVGKTTAAARLGAELARRGRDLLPLNLAPAQGQSHPAIPCSHPGNTGYY